MYRNLGLDLPGCAQLLHVTERTLHNWQSGKHDIPFAAYKLRRLLNRMDLPGESWAGWRFYGGKLWTPEGRSFVGTDGSWWSLLVRQAAMFGEMYRKLQAAEGARRGPACGEVLGAFSGLSTPATVRTEVPVTLQSSLTGETTPETRDVPVTRPFSTAGGTNRPANDYGKEAA